MLDNNLIFLTTTDFFGKAKKILKSDNPFDILDGSKMSAKPKMNSPLEWEPQEFGKY